MMSSIEETQIYIHMIERIRKERKLPLLNLVEGITSERSYRRYLSDGKNIPLHVLEKLMHALNVSVMDMIMFTLQVESKPSGIIELIQYTHNHALDLARPFYELLLNHDKNTKDLNALVSYFLKLYTLNTTDDLDAFKTSIAPFEFMEVEQQHQLEGFCLYVIKHMHFSEKKDPFIHETILKENLHLYQIVLFTQILDMYLLHYINTSYFDFTEYEALSKHMYDVSNLWLDAYNLNAAHFHMGYQYHLSNNEKKALKHIFAYLNLHIITQSKPLGAHKVFIIEQIIQSDIQTFMTTYPSITEF